ncbi:hypothetical protein K470DRAFT_261082 [Piedraia hortae CBS 480.64]|uniref:Uncharacterized protein n=1 Tax=Piedraia hortae CBS 480.64 TaxID=1314780 RepID=A0A6A7BRL5_9PEZI|nr:hypothetical protein K470DRAFT_261082 [Piedraia hortae CBS 480.64]
MHTGTHLLTIITNGLWGLCIVKLTVPVLPFKISAEIHHHRSLQILAQMPVMGNAHGIPARPTPPQSVESSTARRGRGLASAYKGTKQGPFLMWSGGDDHIVNCIGSPEKATNSGARTDCIAQLSNWERWKFEQIHFF